MEIALAYEKFLARTRNRSQYHRTKYEISNALKINKEKIKELRLRMQPQLENGVSCEIIVSPVLGATRKEWAVVNSILLDSYAYIQPASSGPKSPDPHAFEDGFEEASDVLWSIARDLYSKITLPKRFNPDRLPPPSLNIAGHDVQRMMKTTFKISVRGRSKVEKFTGEDLISGYNGYAQNLGLAFSNRFMGEAFKMFVDIDRFGKIEDYELREKIPEDMNDGSGSGPINESDAAFEQWFKRCMRNKKKEVAVEFVRIVQALETERLDYVKDSSEKETWWDALSRQPTPAAIDGIERLE